MNFTRGARHEDQHWQHLAGTWGRARTWAADGLGRLRAGAEGSQAHALAAGGVRTVEAAMGRLRARAKGSQAHALAAGGVRTVGAALELAAGPVGSVMIAAAVEVTAVALATRVVRRVVTERGAEAELPAALAAVIGELSSESLCQPHVAASWRAACGLEDGARVAHAWLPAIGRAAVEVVTSRATTAALRKVGLKKLTRVEAVVSLVRLPGEVRRVYLLVAQAERLARSLPLPGRAGE